MQLKENNRETNNQSDNQLEKKEYPNFICLGIIVNNQGKVLVIRRVREEVSEGGQKLTWAFPGGKLIEAETREQCVEREVLAETGYEILSVKELNLRRHPEFPVVIAYHLCHLKKTQPVKEPSQPWEIAEIRWVKPQELRNLFTTSLDPKVAAELKIA